MTRGAVEPAVAFGDRHRAVLALLIGLAGAMVSCALAVSFDDYGATRRNTPPSAVLFAVRGTVSGLEGERTSLLLNGTSLDVTDGPFEFPATLPDGVAFEVTVRAPEKHACMVERNKGKIAGADVTGVVVACVSRDATLKRLGVSIGRLSPAFDAGKLSYTVTVRTKGVLAADGSVPTTSTVTATPANPAARVSVNGMPLAPGIPSAALVVKEGSNVFDIAVVAPSGSTLHYAVTVVGEGFDYVKASDTTQWAAFGSTVALSGDTLAVASTGRPFNVGTPQVGGPNRNVYVFTRAGSRWSEQWRTTLSGPGVGSVAVDGDTLAAAGYDDQTGMARVAVYTRSGGTWSPQPFDFLVPTFTYAVAVSGDTLAIGLFDLATTGISVRIFRRSGVAWAPEGTFDHAGEAGGPIALALSGDTLAVGYARESSGATGIDGNENDTTASSAGAVFVLARFGTTWSQQAYVKASDTHAGANFGIAVALSGDSLVVGAPGAYVAGPPSMVEGAAYVFTHVGSVWTQQAILKAPSPGPGQFGVAVAFAKDTIAVGAPDSDVGVGAAYLFHGAAGVWTPAARVTPPEGFRVRYGSSVAIAGDVLAVGAPNDSSNATEINGDRTDQSAAAAGAVYVH